MAGFGWEGIMPLNLISRDNKEEGGQSENFKRVLSSRPNTVDHSADRTDHQARIFKMNIVARAFGINELASARETGEIGLQTAPLFFQTVC
jgi:hypothetical protein